MNEELQHYGVKGMKWGVRKNRTWTKEPEGYSIGHQSREMKLKSQIRTEKDRNKKKQLKQDYRDLRAEGKAKIKEYRQFEYDMHKKVGNTSKLKVTKNPDGSRTYRNKKGQTFEKYEVKGAREYETRKRIERKKLGSVVGKTLQTVSTIYVADVMYTGGAVTRSAAKAGKKAVKNAMNKVGDKMFDYAVLDASGKTIYRYN